MAAHTLDLTGLRFGRLTVSHVDHRHPKNGVFWACSCDCGNQHVVLASVLRRGVTTSCGCYRVEWARAKHKKHGMRSHPGYRAWIDAHRRCKGATPKTKKTYLDRGITVCARWRTFEPFWEDMGPTWQEGLSLDRENNDGIYEPGNCRWATSSEQNSNQQRHRPKP